MAATDCDLYLDWHTGSDGNLITDAIAAGSCRPTNPTDVVDAYPGTTLTMMKIETDSASPVAGLIKCGGVEYNFNTTTQGAIYDHTSNYEDMVTADFSTPPPVMSMGFLMKTNLHADYAWHALSGMVGSGEWALVAPRYFDSQQHLYLHAASGYSSTAININNNTWYWVTLQYNRTAKFGYMAVYLASTMEQVGSTLSLAFGGSPSAVSYWTVGQHASQGNTEVANTWYGPVIFDWTDGTFPLLPGAEEPQGGSEILIRLVNGTNDDALSNPLRGHIVSVMPEGHTWGNCECPPEYIVAKVSGVYPDDISGYIKPCPILPPRTLPPRRRKYTLADAHVSVHSYSRPWPETGTRGKPVVRKRYKISETALNLIEYADGPAVISREQFLENLIDTLAN